MATDVEALARSVLCVGFEGSSIATAPLAELRAFGPGAFVLSTRNIDGDVASFIAALRTCADPPPLIALDQEGGRVARVTDPTLVAQVPPAMAMGAGSDLARCEAAALLVGRDLARLGVSVNFAPCADVVSDPRGSVIGTRSFGSDPGEVARCVIATARGFERGGVAAVLKHFPGHGATARDSHLELPRVQLNLADLQAHHLAPFRMAIEARAASIVMTAHLVVDAIDASQPATLSPAVLTDLLRGEYGFDGVIATDCLEMAAIASRIGTVNGALAALTAGADLLLVTRRLDVAHSVSQAIAAAVTEGRVSLARLENAAGRVSRLRQRLARLSPFQGELDPSLPLEAARHAVTIVRGDIRLRSGAPVTVISFEGMLGDGVDGVAQDRRAPSLSSALRSRRWKSELMRVALAPAPDDLDVLLAHIPALGERNIVVVMRRAHLFPAQRAAIDALVTVAPNVILISAREPFDAGLFPAARNVACLYGDEPLAFEGCADILSGQVTAGGLLPVSIDRITDVR